MQQYRSALHEGGDASEIATWMKQVTADRAVAVTALNAARQSRQRMTHDEVHDTLKPLGEFAVCLDVIDPDLRARFYQDVGLEAVYDPQLNVVDVEVRVRNDRVEGGT